MHSPTFHLRTDDVKNILISRLYEQFPRNESAKAVRKNFNTPPSLNFIKQRVHELMGEGNPPPPLHNVVGRKKLYRSGRVKNRYFKKIHMFTLRFELNLRTNAGTVGNRAMERGGYPPPPPPPLTQRRREKKSFIDQEGLRIDISKRYTCLP